MPFVDSTIGKIFKESILIDQYGDGMKTLGKHAAGSAFKQLCQVCRCISIHWHGEAHKPMWRAEVTFTSICDECRLFLESLSTKICNCSARDLLTFGHRCGRKAQIDGYLS
jgi:hypothetical protein